MKNKTFIYLIAFIAFLSCQTVTRAPEPKIILREEEMIDILTDIAFVKAAKTIDRKVFEEKNINSEAMILKKHGVDSIVFAENNIWYADQLEKYEKIFNKVKSNLDEQKDKYEKLKKREDSIKKIKDTLKEKDTLQTKDSLKTDTIKE
ncbi:DUF4296 domain-containing protein [Aquimarina algicola]|uniref:DUF4296 domain-containing protein n=1 Tax=Aquimarina algicola TaxID=2589995 RepID=A0A504JA60_9FLAO|nr:DUF4296 domain-containing protein [Aquimarina algicola]TPN87534.1 DUF4296 domain-containing protein [Aquimarina algicola]